MSKHDRAEHSCPTIPLPYLRLEGRVNRPGRRVCHKALPGPSELQGIGVDLFAENAGHTRVRFRQIGSEDVHYVFQFNDMFNAAIAQKALDEDPEDFRTWFVTEDALREAFAQALAAYGKAVNMTATRTPEDVAFGVLVEHLGILAGA